MNCCEENFLVLIELKDVLAKSNLCVKAESLISNMLDQSRLLKVLRRTHILLANSIDEPSSY